MASEGPDAPKHYPIKTGTWSDNEKTAFLLSIIKSAGAKPNWSSVGIPAGRTLQASQKMFETMMKATADVIMTEGKYITPSQKRGNAVGSSYVNANGAVQKPAAAKKGRAGAGAGAGAKGKAGKKPNGTGTGTSGQKGKGKGKGKGKKAQLEEEDEDDEADEAAAADDDDEDDNGTTIKREHANDEGIDGEEDEEE